jgi:CRISPR/Cas system-associated exonuclease Cas4 (RecB family)
VLAHGVDSEVLEDVRLRIEELVAKVKSGRLHPDPADKQNCTQCDYRRLCRIHGA